MTDAVFFPFQPSDFTEDVEHLHDEMREINDLHARLANPDLTLDEAKEIAREALGSWVGRMEMLLG